MKVAIAGYLFLFRGDRMLQLFQGLKIGSAILRCLRNAENRKDLIDTFMNVLGDCKCTKKECEQIGEKLGVFTEG